LWKENKGGAVPMTLKLNDLDMFMKVIRNSAYPNTEIHVDKLKLLIAQHFGISDYIQDNIMRKLVEFKYLKNVNVNLFEIVGGKSR
jgi:hypothetical protein